MHYVSMSWGSLSDYILEFCVISWWRPCMRTFRFGMIDTFSENWSTDWTKERRARTCYQRAHKGFGGEAGSAAGGAAKTLYLSSISRKSPNGFGTSFPNLYLVIKCSSYSLGMMRFFSRSSKNYCSKLLSCRCTT